MSFNAENLFDSRDNPGNAGDNEYLPAAGWSEDVLAAKVRNLAAVIDRTNGGRVPDLVVLQEVESKDAVETLRQALASGSTYTSVISETSPGRGINVAVLSKLPVRSSKAHPVSFGGADGTCSATRDILETELTLPGGTPLIVYGLHFPSQNNATSCRVAAARRLNELVDSKPADTLALAAGDTNITCAIEDRTAVTEVIRERWDVPDEPNKGCRPPGSYFYQGQWSFFDLIMTNRNLRSNSVAGGAWFADAGSFGTVNSVPEHQIRVDAQGRISPNRFDRTNRVGVSDHFPVAMDLIRRQ